MVGSCICILIMFGILERGTLGSWIFSEEIEAPCLIEALCLINDP